jgi:voltage-gated potassium channel
MSIILMARRFGKALRKALEEPEFAGTLGAACVLILAGSLFYTFNENWKFVDGVYYAVTTLTTTGSGLVIEKDSSKIFTIFFILIGIGILVEVLRGLGMGFVKAEHERKQKRQAKKSQSPT